MDHCRTQIRPGAHPADDISIKFEIRPKFEVLIVFQMYSANHNNILNMPRQCNCRDMFITSLWSFEHILIEFPIQLKQCWWDRELAWNLRISSAIVNDDVPSTNTYSK